jgi:hypothetical protein
MENASTTLLFLTTSFRMIQFNRHRARYVNLVTTSDDFVQEILNSNDEIMLNILSESAWYMKHLTILFWTSALITGNMMCISTAVFAIYSDSTHNNLILHSWFPFNDSLSKNYWVAYGIQYYIMNAGMLIVSKTKNGFMFQNLCVEL